MAWIPARVHVYDLAGRLIRDLAAGDFPAGSYAIICDCTDRSGIPASAGLYLARLETPAGAVFCKLALTR